jgi:hypothetical protein
MNTETPEQPTSLDGILAKPVPGQVTGSSPKIAGFFRRGGIL